MATPKQVQALLNGPAMKAPLGVSYGFINPENLFVWYVLTTVLCVTISSMAVAVRVYTKLRIIRKFGSEDYTCILGFLMFIGYCVPTGLLMKKGGGIHQWNVQLREFIKLLYYMNISAILYGITVFIIKLSILLQYLRIFVPAGTRNWMFWSIWAMIGTNFMFYTAVTFGEIFLCSPREKYWNVLITYGRCGNAYTANTGSGAINAFSDIILLLLPQGVIWKLQMPLKRKIAVSLVFLTGLFVCATSVVRLYYAVRLQQTGDVSYNIAPMGFWTYAELSMGIVCGCLPTSPKFFQAIGQKLSSLTKSGSSLRTIFGSVGLNRSFRKRSGGIDTTDPYDTRGKFDDYVPLKERAKGNNGLSASVTAKQSPEVDRHVPRSARIESFRSPNHDTGEDIAMEMMSIRNNECWPQA